MQLLRRARSLLTRPVLVAALLALMGSVPAADAADRKTLRIGVSEQPAGFHPGLHAQGVLSYIGWMMHRPVTAYDKDWNLFCAMCTELPSRENRRIRSVEMPDGRKALAVRFTLHPKATWGDGTPVTTRDLAFTWELASKPDSPLGDPDFFLRRVISLEVVDDKTFILYREPSTCTPEDLGSLILLPAHLEERVYREDPEGYRTRTTYETNPTNPGLWSGPYRLARRSGVGEASAGAELVLERNPTWFGSRPYFDRIQIRFIEDSAQLERALLAGEVDYVPGEYGFTVHRAAQLERRVADRFRVEWKLGLAYRHMDLNHDHPALKDVRVRRALLHALDREQLNNRLYYGRQIIAHTDIHPMDTVHEEDVPVYDFNPDRAAALLEEAGWTLGADGIRRDGTGRPLELELWAGDGDRTIALEQQMIQDQWRRVGVRATIRTAPARVLFGEVLPERRFNGGAVFSWLSLPRTPALTVLHSGQIPTAANGFTGQNYLGYRNPRMDHILDSIDRVCEPAANQALWSELQRLYAAELPALPIFFQSQAYFLPVWLDGVEATGHQFDSSMRVEYWLPANAR